MILELKDDSTFWNTYFNVGIARKTKVWRQIDSEADFTKSMHVSAACFPRVCGSLKNIEIFHYCNAMSWPFVEKQSWNVTTETTCVLKHAWLQVFLGDAVLNDARTYLVARKEIDTNLKRLAPLHQAQSLWYVVLILLSRKHSARARMGWGCESARHWWR